MAITSTALLAARASSGPTRRGSSASAQFPRRCGAWANRPDWVIPADSPRNPLGAAALVLADNELAIHGTNHPSSLTGNPFPGLYSSAERRDYDCIIAVSKAER